MKLNQRKPELFVFNDDEYRKRAQNMTPDALWQRELIKYRAKVSSGCGVAFSGLMFVPTLGVSTVGLWVSGRTLDIARRKTHIIEAEVNRRNLPHYDRKLRDTFIPLGISLAVITTIGVIDVLCLTGTSASVLNAYAPHGLDALSAAVHDPSGFATALGHGFVFQGQQFFHMGGQQLGLGLDHLHTAINGSGFYDCFQSAAYNVPIPGHEVIAASGLTGIKANAVLDLHSTLAAEGHKHAIQAAAAESNMAMAAAEGKTAALAGANVGMKIAATAETHVAQFLIAHTGAHDSFESMTIKSKSTATPTDAEDKTLEISQTTNLKDSEEAVENVFSQALTGDISKIYVFLGPKGLPISQRIITPPTSQKCQHLNEIIPPPTCRFCSATIDPASEAYYHCCLCSSRIASYDICEVCVAGRGCSCSAREDHILYRQGLLSTEVAKGDLEGLKPPKWSKKKQNNLQSEQIEEDEIKELRKSKWRGIFSKSPRSETPQLPSDSQDNEPGLVEDDFDLESVCSEDEKEQVETSSVISVEEAEAVGRGTWNSRSWWRKEKKLPEVVCVTAVC